MASIATCPQCARQLAVPESATCDDHAECPLCEATFLLANVVQLAVPPARIICMHEQASEITSAEQAEEVPTPTAPLEATTEASALDALPSWEARLKRAIEADAAETSSSADIEDIEIGTPETENVATEPPVAEQHHFEFQLDSPTTPDAPACEPEDVTSESKLSPSSDATFEADLGTPEESSHKRQTSAEEDHAALAATLQTYARQRSPRRSWVKLPALVVSTSVLGTLLGLYALLWLRGPSADFLGLANVLPDAMLPATPMPDQESKLVVTELPDDPNENQTPKPLPPTTPQQQTLLAETDPIVHELPPVSPEASPPQPLHQDESVQPASVEQPAEVPPQAVDTAAEQFTSLVASAQQALPVFVQGDFSTQEATASKGQAYMTLCQLAEQFDFANQPGLSPPLQAQVGNAQELFGKLLFDAKIHDDLAKIASTWWGHSSRSNQGIILTGQVQKIHPLGNQTLCLVAPGGHSTLTAIPVLVERPAITVGTHIGVVGRIASQSESPLAAHGLKLPQVVLSLQSQELP